MNARDIKQVPGRKTDVADCVWPAKLLRYGLLKASFVPEMEIRELRDLCRMRSKIPELTRALEGRVRPHHRFLLKEWMWLLERMEEQILRLEEEIEKRMPPLEWAVTLLMTKPGIDRVAACSLVAEMGVEMHHFPSARHLASWAGVCPGNNESAGKKRSGKSRRGNRWVKGTLTQIAWAAARKKNR